jgi:hypothetical protein
VLVQSSLVAVVIPHKDSVKAWASAHDITGTHEELVANPAVQVRVAAWPR